MTRDTCDICGAPADINDGMVGALLCGTEECLDIAWDRARGTPQDQKLSGAERHARVDLPWTSPPISPNGPRMHPHAHAGRVRGVLDAARYAIRNAQLEPMKRATVELHWRIPDKRRRDADNLLALLKPCLDALVQEGVLHDDSFRYVPAVTCRIHEPNGDPAAMWLTIENLETL